MSDDKAEAGLRALTAESFRHVLGHLPTGVTVLTADGGDGPVGMAANSLTSVSLDPPLILVCPARSSTTWPAIRATGRFCVNVLAGHHEPLSRQFSGPGDRFAGVACRPRDGGPALVDAAAWLDCEIRDEHDAGDHKIVTAEVLAIEAAEAPVPLVFFRGRYGTFAAVRDDVRGAPRIAPAEDGADSLLPRLPAARDGRPMNVFATLAHDRALLRAMAILGAAVTTGSRLAVRDRELAILRTAAAAGCRYELTHHVHLAAEAGIPAEDVEAVVDRSRPLTWASGRDRAVLGAADELLATDALSDGGWDALAPWLDAVQRMELIALVGYYRCLAGLLNALRVAPDALPGVRTMLSSS